MQRNVILRNRESIKKRIFTHPTQSELSFLLLFKVGDIECTKRLAIQAVFS